MDYSTKNLAKKIGKTPQTVRNTAKKLGIVPAEMPNGVLGYSFEQAEQICSYYGVELETDTKEKVPLAAKAEEAVKEQVEEVKPQSSRSEEDEETIRALRTLAQGQLNELLEKDKLIEQQAAKHEEEVRELKEQLARSEKALETQIGITSRLQDLLDKRGDEVRQHLDNTNKLIEQLTQANQAIVAMSTVQAAALAPVGQRTFGQRVKAALAAFRGENEEQA